MRHNSEPKILYVYVTGNIDFAVQIDPTILLVGLIRFNLNRPMECAKSICTSLDQSELKLNIHCNICIYLS